MEDTKMNTGRLANFTDVRWEPLYDTITIGTGALTVADNYFFSAPISATKTKASTNLVNNASLPSPQAFRCYGVHAECFISDRADFNVLPKLLMFSYIRFFVGTKDYLTVPFARIAGGLKLEFDGADSKVGSADVVEIAQFGKAAHFGMRFPKQYFVDIAATENFGVEWVINIVSHTVNTAFDVKMYLDGFRGVDVR
jgi:hypothetical protein